MKDAGYGALLALQFLTRLPVPVVCPWTPATRRWAARSYPLVGLVIGVLLALLGMALRDAWPAPLVALALLSGWVALSGGLHLDGLMDLADALGCQSSGERRWAIMKDPHVGSFAVLALVLHLAWKGMLLWVLLDEGASLWALVAIPALARWGAVALLVGVPAARDEGLAHAWQRSLGHREAWLAALPAVAVLAWVPGGIWLALAMAVFIVIYGGAMRRSFSGINGDIVGAAIEGGELWLLLIAWSWWSYVMV